MVEEPETALGLMSGTSFDGVDAAMLETDGRAIFGFGPTGFLSVNADDMTNTREIWADWTRFRPADEAAARRIDAATQEVDCAHAMAVARLLAQCDADPGVIGYHGQTVAHAPDEGWTWQLGDGERLARTLRRDVVWDFRSADMAAGGQGAPLAPFYHFALAKWIEAEAPLAFLNIGGVANVTWVDPTKDAPEEHDALIAFDTGPGNALLNDWMQSRTGATMDVDGAVAAEGVVRAKGLSGNFGAAYLARPGPKSLDRNDFKGVMTAIDGMSLEDGAATLTAFTAQSIAASVPHMPMAPARWLVCGGGRLNPTMMAMLAEHLAAPVEPVEAVGLNGDMLEAQAFAYLAVRCLKGLPISAPSTTGCAAPTIGGRVSRAP